MSLDDRSGLLTHARVGCQVHEDVRERFAQTKTAALSSCMAQEERLLANVGTRISSEPQGPLPKVTPVTHRHGAWGPEDHGALLAASLAPVSQEQVGERQSDNVLL